MISEWTFDVKKQKKNSIINIEDSIPKTVFFNLNFKSNHNFNFISLHICFIAHFLGRISNYDAHILVTGFSKKKPMHQDLQQLQLTSNHINERKPETKQDISAYQWHHPWQAKPREIWSFSHVFVSISVFTKTSFFRYQ